MRTGVIAKKLGMDALAIRMKNIFVDGDMSYWGEQLHAVGLKETLVKRPERKPGGNRGINTHEFENRGADQGTIRIR